MMSVYPFKVGDFAVVDQGEWLGKLVEVFAVTGHSVRGVVRLVTERGYGLLHSVAGQLT
jgi:hypothetical protein